MELFFTYFNYMNEVLKFGQRFSDEIQSAQVIWSVSGEQYKMYPKTVVFDQTKNFTLVVLYLALEILFLTKPACITFKDICVNVLHIVQLM